MIISPRWLGMAVLIILLSSCSTSRYLSTEQINNDQSVRVLLTDGKEYQGIVIENTGQTFTIVSMDDHQPHQVSFNDIRRIESVKTYYDYQGYPISEAEIEKYRDNRNTWGHAVGGAVIGGLAGLAIGIPIWLANDNPPPLFVGGLGMIVGSIFFGAKGVKRDHQVAVAKVRAVRYRESELQAEKLNEEKRLQELQAEKQRLLKQLKEKKKDSEPKHQ